MGALPSTALCPHAAAPPACRCPACPARMLASVPRIAVPGWLAVNTAAVRRCSILQGRVVVVFFGGGGGEGVRVRSSRCQEGDKYSVRQLSWLCVCLHCLNLKEIYQQWKCAFWVTRMLPTKQKERERERGEKRQFTVTGKSIPLEWKTKRGGGGGDTLKRDTERDQLNQSLSSDNIRSSWNDWVAASTSNIPRPADHPPNRCD